MCQSRWTGYTCPKQGCQRCSALAAANTTQEANANGGNGGNGVVGRKLLTLKKPPKFVFLVGKCYATHAGLAADVDAYCLVLLRPCIYHAGSCPILYSFGSVALLRPLMFACSAHKS